MSRLRVLSFLAVSSVIVAACAPVEAPGIVMFAVSTNLVPGQDFQRGYVQFATVDDLQGDTLSQGQEFYLSEAPFPFTVALRGTTSEPDKKYTARARIMLIKGGEEIIGDGVAVVVRDVVVQLPPPGTIQMVHVSLDWLSMLESKFPQVRNLIDGVLSGGAAFPSITDECTNTRNARGECVHLIVDERGGFDSKVVAYDPTQIFGGGSSPTDPAATCFPATACFAGAKTFSVTAADNCKLTLDSDFGSSFSVAVLTKSAAPLNVLRCSEQGCGDDLGDARGVVLDNEALGIDGGVVTLPELVCRRLGGTAEVRVSKLCEKQRSMPLCPNRPGEPGRVDAKNRLLQ